jgi:hypothetical protein
VFPLLGYVAEPLRYINLAQPKSAAYLRQLQSPKHGAKCCPRPCMSGPEILVIN